MQNTFDRIEQLVAELKTLQPIGLEAGKKLDKKFRLEFNYNSNHLEGNTLTYGETELLLLFDDTRGAHTMREYEEMKAHDAAWQMIEGWAADKERPLTEQAIKNLNEVILVRPFWKEAITPDGQQTRREIKIGAYKQYPNSARLANGEMFEYASPFETPALMQELLDWYRAKESSLHPVTLAAMMHYKFVRIHPFDDGNGRISRMLMNYVLLRNDLPPVIIKSEQKQAYLRVLHIADIGDFGPFISYVAEQLEWSLRISIKAARGESVEEDNDWEKKLHLLKNITGTSGLVTIKKGTEAYKLAFKNIILPFFTSWEESLQKFDPLFNNRVCQITVEGSQIGIQDNNLLIAIKKFFHEDGTLTPLIQNKPDVTLRITISFSDLRATDIKANFNGGKADIFFFNHAVTITTNANATISKLYSETLLESDAKFLLNGMNTWVMNHLKEYINSQNQ